MLGEPGRGAWDSKGQGAFSPTAILHTPSISALDTAVPITSAWKPTHSLAHAPSPNPGPLLGGRGRG